MEDVLWHRMARFEDFCSLSQDKADQVLTCYNI